MKQRNHTFDFLCGVCIIRMITLHTISFCNHVHDDAWRTIMSWSFFFMCFFFFKAGYFNKTVSGNSKEYVKDKAKRLLVPYLSWGIIGMAVYFAFIPFEIKRYGHPIEPLEWPHIWNTSGFWGNGPLWFLFSFFSAYVMVHYMKKIHIIKPISVFQTVLVLCFPFISYWLFTLDNPLPMNLNNVFMGVFFFYAGRSWKWCLDRLTRKQAMTICSVFIIAFIISNILWHGEYTMSLNKFDGNPVASFANTLIILLGLSGLFIKLPLPRIPVINFIGEHSMVYFVAHYPLLEFYRFTHISFGHSIYGRWDDFIILLVFTFVTCSWLVPFVESIPLLSGRWKTKPKQEAQTQTA